MRLEIGGFGSLFFIQRGYMSNVRLNRSGGSLWCLLALVLMIPSLVMASPIKCGKFKTPHEFCASRKMGSLVIAKNISKDYFDFSCVIDQKNYGSSSCIGSGVGQYYFHVKSIKLDVQKAILESQKIRQSGERFVK